MKIYEKYHSNRSKQKWIIKDNDFTYNELLSFLHKFSLHNKRILDIGCGVGTIDFYIAKQCVNVLGIDISQNAISMAKKNAKILGVSEYAKFEVISFPRSIPKGRFDIIICSEVLEHLKDDTKAIKSIKKLLRKNGVVIASSPSQNAPLYRIGLLNKFDREVGHLRRYTIDSFKDLFENVGFKILEFKKTEGILRNFLFTNSLGGFLLRILNKQPFSDVVTFVDNLFITVFGESNLYLVAQKK